jgi:hypothetical protein
VELWQLILLVGSLLSTAAAFIWTAVSLHAVSHPSVKPSSNDLGNKPEKDIEHIFNETFREELRNRGRLHFDKIIGENAMFLQQDLRLTGSQLNDFMKQEISRTLQEEFKKYEQSIGDAKQIALDTIEKTRQAIEEQRGALDKQLRTEIEEEKARYLVRFEKNMAEIINHYILAAVGDQISLDDQLEYILDDLETNKQEILADIKNGA